MKKLTPTEWRKKQIEIRVNNENKIAEIWLTKGERDDINLRSSLGAIYREYSSKNYTPMVYMSGYEELYDSTEALLPYNRQRPAESEMRKAKSRER